jgi:uncharacterized protein YacL
MKTLLKVFGILAVLAALVTCGLSITRNLGDAEDSKKIGGEKAELVKTVDNYKAMIDSTFDGAAKVELQAEMKKATDMLDKIPSTNTFYLMTALIIFLLIVSLYSAVLFFKSNTKTATILLAASLVLFGVLYFISPDIKTGEYGPASPRSLALACGIPAVLCALFAFLISKMPGKNATVATIETTA